MSRSKRLPKVLTLEEQRLLVAQPSARYPSGLRNKAMLRVMLEAGLRSGEVVALRPEHLDMLTCRLNVREGKGAKDRFVGVRRSSRPISPHADLRVRIDSGQLGAKDGRADEVMAGRRRFEGQYFRAEARQVETLICEAATAGTPRLKDVVKSVGLGSRFQALLRGERHPISQRRRTVRRERACD